MTKKYLTQSQILKVKGNGKKQQLPLADKLFLLVQPSGKTSFLYSYRQPVSKIIKRKSLGTTEQMSLDQAKETAIKFNILLSKGVDPLEYEEQQAKQEQRRRITLNEIALDWQEMKSKNLKPKTLSDQIARFHNHLFPILGDIAITEITLADAREKIKPIYDKTPHMGEKVARDLRSLGNHAVEMGVLDNNHLLLIKNSFQRPKSKNNKHIKAEELPEFMRRLANSNLQLQTRLLIEFQLLTMVRAKEIVTAEWADIDFNSACWHIPAGKMKGGKKAHDVPLSRQALAILKEMRQHTAQQKYVFAHRSEHGKHCSSGTATQAFKRALGYKGIMTPHGMRGLVRTYLSDKNITFYEVAEACLSHKHGDAVSKAYNKSTYYEQRQIVMQQWGDFVEQCKKA
ncbi:MULTISPECIES: tyrosine-type recombinase/integrase [unclassified Lonepinella]|uniref:tyrosine-type recombinase/integrase n=1 Tax=unclassified Lonepinella TaxID=2642006 RepID=UPI0036DB5F64